MPVKDQTIYPPYWKQFSQWVRFERADNKCEVCGALNYQTGRHAKDGTWYSEDQIHGLNSSVGMSLYGDDFDWRMAKVILTVAHLDAEGDICRCQDETGYLCANPEHVKAMCQKCHNGYDRPKRNKNAQATLAAKKDAGRLLFAA